MDKPWLCFQIADEWYLHDLSRVREIIPYEEPSPVPGGGAEALGMLTLRDEVIAIFSGRRLLSAEDKPADADSKIITLLGENGVFGMVVDSVSEILYVDPENIEYTPGAREGQLVQGTVSHDGRLYIIVDCSGVVKRDSD